MKYFFSLLAALSAVAAFAGMPPAGHWPVNSIFLISMEFAAPDQIIHASLYGPANKEALCERAGAAAFSQAPKGHSYVSVCLHVAFTKPLGPKGVVVMQPYAGTPLEFLLVGADYNADGSYRSAGALHAVHDMKTCERQAHDIIDSNYKDGTIVKGVSALIYCVPVYPLPSSKRAPNGDEIV
ncbi:MAG: hypothetical protein ACRD3F_15225 [Acidobacteriaceae bacterium]